MKNKFLKLNRLTILLIGVFLLVGSADAQTSRRKKRTKKTPVAASVVAPETNGNTQYLDGNQIVFGEIPSEKTTTETPVPPTDTQPAETEADGQIKELNSRLKTLEAAKKNDPDQKQQRLLLNLDILTRAETRSESLRKQLFEMIEKENSVKMRLEQIQADARPEVIERSVALVGTLRPEELRDQRKKSLDIEKTNLETLLTQIQTSRANLETNVEKSDALVEKIRAKLDKEIDNALTDDGENKDKNN